MTPLEQAIAAVRAALPSDAMPVADPLALAVERLLVAMDAERDALRAQVNAAAALADIVRRELPEAGQPITSQSDLDKARALTVYCTARKATT